MSTSPRRLERMREVLSRRLARVRCAVEAVRHRHNISAILRTCDALGLHHVHLCAGGHFTPSNGASRGAERWLDLHHHLTTAEALRALGQAGVEVYVADLDEEAVVPEEVPVDRPVCLWFGAELVGVSEEARAAAAGVVKVPMHGFAQSLNVSVSAALALRPVAERARALGPEVLLDRAEQERTWARWMEREARLRDGVAHRQMLTPLLED